MTVLPLGDAKGRAAPAEGEEPHRSCRLSISGKFSSEESALYEKAKEFLGGDYDEKILKELIKNSLTTHNSNHDNALNELISLYFDRLESLRERQTKQVRFEEHLDFPSSSRGLPATVVARPLVTADRGSDVIDLSADDAKKEWEVTDNREEQDMAKAIEASLKENQSIPGFSPLAQKDPENPYERLRVDLAPVGLKNIGNSCWFNVIIQTLFNIPAFRQMLLYYEFQSSGPNAVPCDDKPSSSAESARPVSFIVTLRRLFAFLLASKRSYIDPTETINVVNDLATTLIKAVSCVGIQQDCTEMLLRFTEWLEEAFKLSNVSGTSNFPSKIINIWGSPKSVEDDSVNDENIAPMNSQGPETGSLEKMDHTSKEEPTEEFFVQNEEKLSDLDSPHAMDSSVNCCDDSESEGMIPAKSSGDATSCNPNKFTSMFHGSHIEYRNSQVDSSSGLKNKFQLINLDVSFGNLHDSFEAYHLSGFPLNELWYETAPPVIVFSLVRFSYKNGQTEKLHSRFHFPRSFYLDRYLMKNRDYVLEKRVKKNCLDKKRSILLKQLERVLKHPVGETHESIPHIINSLLTFFKGNPEQSFAPPEGGEPMEICEESIPSFGTGPEVTFDHSGEGSEISAASTAMGDILAKGARIPEYSDEEVANVTNFLSKFARRVQSKIIALERDLDSFNNEIETIFDVDTLRKECYRLHSVIIHEGEANVGHYWAYIADYSALDQNGMPVVWRKYNDKRVEIATYEQMAEDAYGTKRTCSAYCIVYTRCQSESTLFGNDPFSCAESFNQVVDLLPMDLKKAVSEDNDDMANELVVWNKQQNVELIGPRNRPESSNFANIISDPDVKFLLNASIVSKDFDEVICRHYKDAYQFCGSVVVAKMSDQLRQGVSENGVYSNDEMARRLLEEIFGNNLESFHEIFIDENNGHVDPRAVLSEWVKVYDIKMTGLASQIFFLRMLANNSKLSKICGEKIEAIEPQFRNQIEDEIRALHTLYELYCYAIGVLAEAARQVLNSKGTRELKTDIKQARLVCFALRLLEKFWFYCKLGGGVSKDTDVDLTLIVLLIISSVHVSQDLVEYLSDTTDDRILDENEAFLAEEYRLLIYRLQKYDSESTFFVRKKMLQEAREHELSFARIPSVVVPENYEVVKDLECIATLVSKAAFREPKAMQLLLKSAAAGAKIKSLQSLPEEEVPEAPS